MFKHNSTVFKNKSGTLKPMRRPGKQTAVEDYSVCEHCLGLFLSRDLWKHVRACRHKPPGPKQKRNRYRGNIHLLAGNCGVAPDGLQNDILKRMNPGKIAIVVRNDSLILRYGNNMHFQHAHHPHRLQYVSQKLRQLGRLLITVRSLDSSIHQLSECIAPSKFEVVANAVRIVSGFDNTTHLYKTGSATTVSLAAVSDITGLMTDSEITGSATTTSLAAVSHITGLITDSEITGSATTASLAAVSDITGLITVSEITGSATTVSLAAVFHITGLMTDSEITGSATIASLAAVSDITGLMTDSEITGSARTASLAAVSDITGLMTDSEITGSATTALLAAVSHITGLITDSEITGSGTTAVLNE